jgi:hypothetical protein
MKLYVVQLECGSLRFYVEASSVDRAIKRAQKEAEDDDATKDERAFRSIECLGVVLR